MKKAEKDNPVNAIPKGAYEAGSSNKSLHNQNQNLNDLTTDIQGNGYPVTDNTNPSLKPYQKICTKTH